MKLLTAALSLALITACTPMMEEEKHAINCTSKGTHNVMLKDIIRSNLRSPSTAEFIGVTDTYFQQLPECRMLIKGYVDSQNGFGATVRTHYTAVTRYEKSNSSIIAEKLDM